MKSFIKICGLATAADVAATAACAPDALGFIFWAKSPRAVTPAQVGEWTRDLPPGLRKVGVFVDALPEEIQRSAEVAGLDVIQLHGDQMFEDLGLPVWKVLHLDRLPSGFEKFPAEAYLIDSGTVDMPGGTGVRVDTERATAFVKQSKLPVVLAGGLKAGTVGDAIREVRPSGVDVSSGVERCPGHKDLGAVRDFIHQARDAFQHSK
jgi:phosphoribosylanthranilate isomerase